MAAIAHDPNSLDDLSESAFLGLVAAILGSAGFDITEVTRRGDSADYWINHVNVVPRGKVLGSF